MAKKKMSKFDPDKEYGGLAVFIDKPLDSFGKSEKWNLGGVSIIVNAKFDKDDAVYKKVKSTLEEMMNSIVPEEHRSLVEWRDKIPSAPTFDNLYFNGAIMWKYIPKNRRVG